MSINLLQEVLKQIEFNGYEQIYWMIGYSNPISNNVHRLRSFLDYMKTKNLNGKDFIYRFSERSVNAISDAYLGISKIMTEYTSKRKAIFADGPLTLQIVLAGLKSQNIAVPYQIGVCGFDMWNWSSVMNPSISSIYLPVRELAKAAAQLIVDRVEKGNALERQKIVLNPNYVLRESTERY